MTEPERLAVTQLLAALEPMVQDGPPVVWKDGFETYQCCGVAPWEPHGGDCQWDRMVVAYKGLRRVMEPA